MQVKVNDREKRIEAGMSVKAFLEKNGFPPDKTLTALNGNALAPDEIETALLQNGDSLELFTFVGGG